MRHWFFLAILSFTMWSYSSHAVRGQSDMPSIASFLETHCQACHEGGAAEGGLDLSSLAFEPQSGSNFDRWVKIYDRVESGEMPPEQESELAAPERQRFTAQLYAALVSAEKRRLGNEGRVVRRRMNRFEFENTLRDLFAIPVLETRDFLPEDRVAFGFNKIGAALDMSHVQLSRYLDATEYALRQAMAPQAARPEVTTQRYYAWDMPGFRKFAGPTIRMTQSIYDMKIQQRRGRGRRGSEDQQDDAHDREKEAVVMVTSTYEPAEIQFNRFRAPMTAKYRLRFSGYSVWMSSDFKTVSPGHASEPVTVYSDRTPGLFRKLFSYDVQPGPEPTVVEKEVWMIAGETIRPDAARLVRCRPPDFQNPHAEADGMPGVAWQWMEVEGPLFQQWPPPGHQLLFDDLPIEDAEAPSADGNETNQWLSAIGLRSFRGPSGTQAIPAHPSRDAQRLLRRFMELSYRRPIVEDDFRAFLDVAEQRLASGDSFTDAMLAAYMGVLSSPEFLFFDEQPGELSDRALADRLAYFLWNSRPDDRLLQLAASRSLHLPDVLRQETERLLDDPRASRFIDAFLDYWLDLRLITQTSPDIELYPEYDLDDLLVESAIDETRMYFTDLVQRDLGVSYLIDSDFTFLNNRLAVHYGIPNVTGIEMRRVPLPVDSVRGGLMTQASVLKVTANGTTTSPIMRGAWVLTRLLGDAPEPPPAAVPAVQPDTRGATTIREQLEKHRSDESCNACHRHIDPPGFALENFDVLGGWRDRYRSLGQGTASQGVGHNGQRFAYFHALPVDASGALHDGQEFQDVRQLKTCLLGDQRQLARNMTQQLAIYATGGEIRFSDRPTIEKILENAQSNGYGIRTLIHEVVQSELFRSK